MADYKIVDTQQLEADLTAVADALRANGVTTDSMAFPEGFVNAVNATDAEWIACLEGTADEITVPEGCKTLKKEAFKNETAIKKIKLPTTLTSIGNYAFNNCTNLALTSLPEGLTSIGSNAFYNCTKLTSITFKGTPKTIHSTSFAGCTNIMDINVPWAEGAVANAPWGATNATIHYNHTPEGQEE